MRIFGLFREKRLQEAKRDLFEIPVYFTVEWNCISKSEAKATGLFMPPMTDPEQSLGKEFLLTSARNGYTIFQGSEVWICKLFWKLVPSTGAFADEPVWSELPQNKILLNETRADNREDAGRHMQNWIRDEFFGMVRRLRLQEFNQAQMLRAMRERDALANFVKETAGQAKVSELCGTENAK